VNERAIRSLPVLLIPTGVVPLLVPGASVAEVVGLHHLSTTQGRNHVIGTASWRGLNVPVVSFESLCNSGQVQPRPRSKIVVFYPLPGHPKLDFFAMLSSADPRSSLVDEPRMAEDGSGDAGPFLLQRCRLDGAAAAIPDLAAIRNELSDLSNK